MNSFWMNKKQIYSSATLTTLDIFKGLRPADHTVALVMGNSQWHGHVLLRHGG